jgi:S-disulfanyl-L-cysteine oxidoreductase SoxD
LLFTAAVSLPVFAGVAAVAETHIPLHFADADNDGVVTQGELVYAQNCANCHGRRLQGQALWQLRDQYEGRRAPPHDSTGHTWQHSDDELFTVVKTGKFSTTSKDIVSYMPAFDKRLSDDDIVAVLAFIKSRWPIGIRASQSMLNPNHKGMPKGADKVDWTLPPNCTASFQRWGATSQ